MVNTRDAVCTLFKRMAAVAAEDTCKYTGCHARVYTIKEAVTASQPASKPRWLLTWGVRPCNNMAVNTASILLAADFQNSAEGP